MHSGDSLKEKIVVLATFGRTEHPDDVGDEVHVLRSSLETRSEEADEVFTACNLAADEQSFEIALCPRIVIVLLHLLEHGDGILISVDHIFSSQFIILEERDCGIEVKQEYVRKSLLLILTDDLVQLIIDELVVILDVLRDVKTLVVKSLHLALRIGGSPLVLESEKGIDPCLTECRILSLCYFLLHQSGTLDKHVLPG